MKTKYEYTVSVEMPLPEKTGTFSKKHCLSAYVFKNQFGHFCQVYRRIFYKPGVFGEWKLYREGRRNPVTLKPMIERGM